MQKFTAKAYIFSVLIVLVVFPHSAWTQPLSPSSLSGRYIGNIPCADCEKIVFTLLLEGDFTYSSSMEYVGKSAQPFTEHGLFRITENGLLELDTTRQGMKFFQKRPEGLLMLDTAGNQITGALAEKYMLYGEGKKGRTKTKACR